MADNQNSDDLPTIKLDEEDRRAYQKAKQPASGKKNKPASDDNTKTSSGGKGAWLFIIALLAVAACGGCYYLYTLLQQQQASAQQAEKRIAQLERRLSATGEEIGESTVALQVKVNDLGAKTEELWEQMDKLWASAWRRNQKEIADLGDRVTSVQNSLKGNISEVSQDVSAQAKQLSSVKNQLATTADDLLGLNVQLEQAQADKQSNARTVKNLNDKISVLEQRNNALSGRISKLERELREMATKVVSGSSSPANSSSPAPDAGQGTGQ
ncbi:hypothetical protein [Alteromonas halophila]|uniref:Uncharacterized protein n=1 Tax=Alteromonas halophila TaxID=516698 RepID=A0A918JM76_9ALTE|nr:hypothetical protein [Alteromonas halophila]GGW89378.1 hypothetical protein GCM10007391_24520 [Alteromonas halophila]